MTETDMRHITQESNLTAKRVQSKVLPKNRESLADDPRLYQENTVITADLIDKVDDLVRSDRRVTLRMLAVKVDVSVGKVWAIVQDRLRYRKVCRNGSDLLLLHPGLRDGRDGMLFDRLQSVWKCSGQRGRGSAKE
ncbi:hypothetical protein HNY73_021413 [Argiope bruennichi]|uniref:Uncharacterized protein n=1 Tax=Argiope bruennichi TaxID=94029 RepID=A0A8T0DZ30_ARGBR|nr:hypothetical protein HNY73_021413 [Argiope bruennichi]